MVQRLSPILLSLFILISSQSPSAYAQNQGTTSTPGPRKQLATIVFAGLAGAVLGLSTLSFYGRPQDKLPNIGIGLGVGIIVGTVYTTYQAATKPREFYGSSDYKWNSDWEGAALDRSSFESSKVSHSPISLGYSWNF